MEKYEQVNFVREHLNSAYWQLAIAMNEGFPNGFVADYWERVVAIHQQLEDLSHEVDHWYREAIRG